MIVVSSSNWLIDGIFTTWTNCWHFISDCWTNENCQIGADFNTKYWFSANSLFCTVAVKQTQVVDLVCQYTQLDCDQ